MINQRGEIKTGRPYGINISLFVEAVLITAVLIGTKGSFEDRQPSVTLPSNDGSLNPITLNKGK